MNSSRSHNLPSLGEGRHLPDLVVVDMETTGPSPEQDHIIKIVAAKVGFDGSVGPYFSTFVRPGDRLSPGVTTSTGIRDVDVAGAPAPGEALIALSRYVEGASRGATGDPIIVTYKGHRHFVAAACSRDSLPMCPMHVIDSLFFYFDFASNSCCRTSPPADLADVIIVPDTIGAALVFIDMSAWLGIDSDALPYPRSDGAEIRLRLFTRTVRRFLREYTPGYIAKQLKSRAEEADFVAGQMR